MANLTITAIKERVRELYVEFWGLSTEEIDEDAVNYWALDVQARGLNTGWGTAFHELTRQLKASPNHTAYTERQDIQDQVSARYEDLVGEAPDAEGLDYWARQIYQASNPNTATGRPTRAYNYSGLENALKDDSRYTKQLEGKIEGIINNIYQEKLGRNADTSGLNHWKNVFSNEGYKYGASQNFTTSISDLEDAIVNSLEHKERAFHNQLQALYDSHNQPLTEKAKKYWTKQYVSANDSVNKNYSTALTSIGNQIKADQAAAQLEDLKDDIRDVYDKHKWSLDDEALDYWAKSITDNNDITLKTLEDQIISDKADAEAEALALTNTQTAIKNAFDTKLGRDPSGKELDEWTEKIHTNKSETIDDLNSWIANTEEHKGRRFTQLIEDVYKEKGIELNTTDSAILRSKYFDPAKAADYDYATELAEIGTNLDTEIRNDAVNAASADIRQAYLDAEINPPQGDDLTQLAEQIVDDDNYSLEDIGNRIQDEKDAAAKAAADALARTNRLTDLLTTTYETKVGRKPDQDGLDHWLPLLEATKNDDQEAAVIADLTGSLEASDEYKDRQELQEAFPNVSEVVLDTLSSSLDVKGWHQNYGGDTSNFKDTLTDLDPNAVYEINQQMIGLLEDKGLITDPKEGVNYIEHFQDEAWKKITEEGGGVLEALNYIAGLGEHETAVGRGDIWGAHLTRGRKFLEAAQEDSSKSFQSSDVEDFVQHNFDLVSELYLEGFGREPDEKGVLEWLTEISDKGHTYQTVAGLFLDSEEAQIRDIYHEHYGRDVDDEGLQYWLSAPYGDASDIVKATLSDPDTPETSLRQLYGEYLGLFSTEEAKKAYMQAGGIWTDPIEGTYANLNWQDYLAGQGWDDFEATYLQQQQHFTYDPGHRDDDDLPLGSDDLGLTDTTYYPDSVESLQGLGEDVAAVTAGDKTIDDVTQELAEEEEGHEIISGGDGDDAEGGSGIMNMPTDAEVAEYLGLTPEQQEAVRNDLGETQWAAVTAEVIKAWDGEKWIYPYGKGAGGVMYTPGFEKDEKGTNTNTLTPESQLPTISDYKPPEPINITTTKVEDYIPDNVGKTYDADKTLTELDTSKVPKIPKGSKPTQLPKFIPGTSAKGVRLKRSEVAKSGASALGTRQLSRDHVPTPLSSSYQKPEKVFNFNLDVDGDGKVTALSDGMMILRKMFGTAFAGDALTDKAISTGATRTTDEIHHYIDEGIKSSTKTKSLNI